MLQPGWGKDIFPNLLDLFWGKVIAGNTCDITDEEEEPLEVTEFLLLERRDHGFRTFWRCVRKKSRFDLFFPLMVSS